MGHSIILNNFKPEISAIFYVHWWSKLGGDLKVTQKGLRTVPNFSMSESRQVYETFSHQTCAQWHQMWKVTTLFRGSFMVN